MLGAWLGIGHVKALEGLEDDRRNDQACVFLVVGGNDMPRRDVGACFIKAGLVGAHVVVPMFALLDIGGRELPVFVGLIDALKKALALGVFGLVQEKLDDAHAVSMQVAFKLDDRAIALLPDRLFVAQLFGNVLSEQQLRMHAHNQHLFVVRAVKNADPPALRKAARRAPKKVVIQLFGARLLKAKHLAALRIDAGHDVPNRAVLSGGIHALKNHQHGIEIGRVVHALQLGKLFNLALKQLAVFLFGLVDGLHLRRPLVEVDVCAFGDAKVTGIDGMLHGSQYGTTRCRTPCCASTASKCQALRKSNAAQLRWI